MTHPVLRILVLSLAAFSALTLYLVVQNTGIAQEQSGETAAVTTATGTTEPLVNQIGGNDSRLYEDLIKPLLQQSCFDCHSGDSAEGNFRADELDPDMVSGADVAWWLEVYSVLSKEEMPPPESSQLADGDRAEIVNWLSTQIQAADKLRQAGSHRSSFRRLTKYEYNYALQDLLGVPWTFSGDLPSEASEDDGFENSADSLHMSVKQLETYHQLALQALRRVTVRGDRPPMVHWLIPMKEAFRREKKKLDRDIESIEKKFKGQPDKIPAEVERLTKAFQANPNRSHYIDVSTGLRAAVEWNYRKASYAFPPAETGNARPGIGSHFAVVQPGSRQALTIELGDKLPDQGTMRVRIRASRAEGTRKKKPSLQLHFGFQATDQGRSIERVSQHERVVQAAFGQPEFYQWDIPLGEIEHRNTYRGEMKLGQQPSPSEYIRFTNNTMDDGTGVESSAILIDHIEVAAPVFDVWPPLSHRGLFVASDQADDEDAYAKQIVAEFMSRAWRRPAAAMDVDRKLRLFAGLRPHSPDFQDAILEVLATILASPKFLYVMPGEPDTRPDRSSEEISQRQLATRLSLLFWCSLPDETLARLAAKGRLAEERVLEQQVDRMLADPRAARFKRHFVLQWLKMQPLEFLVPSRGGDGIDLALLESMKEEPIELFTDMLARNSSVLEFIDANYVVINERLAKHYGIGDVRGNHFRRVELTDGRSRGGILTHAGLLTMNSDGQDSHPVKRGVWLLTNLLNDPPPPPPPAVPEIDLSDPEIAKLSLKERIEDHRNHAACMSCHQKIDPWGIAFENYDALGRWRDRIDGERVDATSVLPSATTLDGMRGLKEHLLERCQDDFVRATIEKLTSFALGRKLDFGDRAGVTEIARRVRNSNDGVRTMIKCIVTSELFIAK